MRELRVALFLAVKSIARAQKSASILLVFILFLSFLNLMFITGILSGLSAAIVRQSIETTSSYIDIDPQQSPVQQPYIADQRDLRARVEAVPGVISTARHYALGGSMAYDRQKSGHVTAIQSQILGIDPADEQRVTTISEHMMAGEYLDTTHQDDIVLGADVAGGYGFSRILLGILFYLVERSRVCAERVQLRLKDTHQRRSGLQTTYRVRAGVSRNSTDAEG